METWKKCPTDSTVWIFLLSIIANILTETLSFGSDGFIRQPNMCVPIPADLKLCHDVGYERMVLPNLLNHESLDEARQQAASFMPLLYQNCHPHLKEFLCSLFAPVCLPPDMAILGPIPPCKSLCKSVQRSCTPIMRRHNFNWPSMLNCSKFRSREPCISFNETNSSPHTSITTTPDPNVCAPCGTDYGDNDVLHDNFCASEFVVKVRVKKVKQKRHRGLRILTVDRRRRIIYKQGPLVKKDLRKMKLVVKGSKKCKCPQLDRLVAGGKSKRKKKGKKSKMFFLVMGRKIKKKLSVTVLHAWPKGNRVLHRASRRNFRASECPEFGSIDTS